MAIYHMTTKPISRKSGRSATASSAYRNGCKIKDERTGLEHDYSKKKGVLFSYCFDKDFKELDRNELWNKAELAENRKDARTAREFIVAIPFELIPDNKKDIENPRKNVGAKIAFEFGLLLAKKYGVGVDVAIHEPDKNGDQKNYHAHIMTTTRRIEKTENAGIEFGHKSIIELSNKKLNELNLPKTQEQVKELRKAWADIANKHLDDKNKIDHRSYAEQGKDQIPSIKLGWKASDMERKGKKTERGDINRKIRQDNERINELKQQIRNDISIEFANAKTPFFNIPKPKPKPETEPDEPEQPKPKPKPEPKPKPDLNLNERLQKMKQQNSNSEEVIEPKKDDDDNEIIDDYTPTFRP